MKSLSLPRGTRVELTDAPADYQEYGLTAGQHGTVEFTDSIGTIHIRWDDGTRLGITAESRGLICQNPPEPAP